jgi:hypothetical protein
MIESVAIFILVLLFHNKGLKFYNYLCDRLKMPQRMVSYKEYSIKPLFKDWSVYPVMALLIVYIILEIDIFTGNYRVANLRGMMKFAYIATVGIMVYRHKIYKPGFVGSICVLVGGLLNIVVERANGGKMPVYATFTLVTGYIRSLNDINDGIHVIGTASTHLKFLADWMDDGLNVMSVGDILFRMFAIIVLYYSVKSLNESKASE